jgi:hypothetical protein
LWKNFIPQFQAFATIKFRQSAPLGGLHSESTSTPLVSVTYVWAQFGPQRA